MKMFASPWIILEVAISPQPAEARGNKSWLNDSGVLVTVHMGTRGTRGQMGTPARDREPNDNPLSIVFQNES